MSQTGNTGQQSGFTLLELIVVLTISGILLALTPPLFSSIMPEYRAAGASKKLTSYLLRARHEAIVEGKIISVSISSAGYGRQGSNKIQQWPTQVILKHLSEVWVEENREEIILKFFPDGSSSGARIRLASGTRSVSVLVNWLTGQVVSNE